MAEDYIERLYRALKENNADFAYCGFVEWYSAEKTIARTLPEGIYTKAEWVKEHLLRRPNMWCGIYKKSIIEKFNIEFDILLRRMEDGCFVTDYIVCCEKIVAIKDCLYFYYQRDNSVIHEYRAQTLLGVERDMYIWDKLYAAFLRSDVDKDIYMPSFYQAWSTFMIREAINFTHHKHPSDRREKRRLMKEAMAVSKIQKKLCLIDKEKISITQRLFVRWIKKERIKIMLFYGRTFNFLRRLKQRIRG